MRPALSRCNRRSDACTGPNWRGVGQVEVHADMRAASVAPGAVLVVDFDRRRVVAGGCFLVTARGNPEVLRLRRFPQGLKARIGSRWQFVTRAGLRDFDVIGRVVKLLPDAFSQCSPLQPV